VVHRQDKALIPGIDFFLIPVSLLILVGRKSYFRINESRRFSNSSLSLTSSSACFRQRFLYDDGHMASLFKYIPLD